MSTRRSGVPKTVTADVRQFADDVQYYLAQSPRQLPSQYLYDDLGSALFDAICRLPWYPITRSELALLAAHGRAIFDAVQPATLVELGPGNGEKIAALLDASTDDPRAVVHLVDISAAALETAGHTLARRRGITVIKHQTDYESGLFDSVRGKHGAGRTLALFLGSNIGNFDPPGAEAFLRNIRAALVPGDALLIGADLVKSEAELLLAYDDPLQVTAAFNRNLLVRANRELAADFDVASFAHRAVWAADASRVEMHLVSLRRQRVSIPACRLDIVFEPEETIWTESSYKYTPADVVAALRRAGFAAVDQWLDDAGGFALTLVEAK